MRSRRILWVAICGLLALAGSAVAGGLGVGRGIDHVASLVRLENFDSDTSFLSDQLGFSITPALLSPAGAKNRLIWFSDLSYLEVDAFTEDNEFTAPFLGFLDRHEGAKFYGTEVVDAERALTFLNGAGYPAAGPVPAGPLTIESTGQVLGLTPLWNSIVLTSRVAPDNSNFFLDYNEAQVRRMFRSFPVLAPRPHANTAQKIDTLWLVVSDLDAARAFYRGLGLKVRSRERRIDYLGARGAEVLYQSATLLLLEPDGPGLAADFAADRGEGILGVSIQVGKLRVAHDLVEHNTGLTLPIFKDRGRSRFLIPASSTHGVLMEMVEE
jgi:catechol 2,3-dioxygenase-like lactoylglutathione lyase family enzyme